MEMNSIILFSGIMIGFFLPGFLLNRILSRKNDFGAAYIVSSVILFQVIFWTGISGIKISLISVGIILILINLSLFCFCLIKGIEFKTSISLTPPITRIEKLLLLPVFLSVLLIFLKSSILTNPGGDQAFRWYFLASRILETGSFSFYPPLTAEDYNFYFYTDSFPPIISFSYFWLYSLFGKTATFLACIPVTLQYIFILIFGFRLASLHFGSSKAGVFAILLIGSSTLLFHSIAIAQETGMTALCSLATVYFLAKNKPCTVSDCLLASFSASLGALSREYGGVFILFGIIVILWLKMPLKNLIFYILFCIILAGPWYIRIFALTGNPFYSNPVGQLFPVNQVHTGIFEGYREAIGLKSYMTWKVIPPLAAGLSIAIGISFFTGLISSAMRFKRLGFYLIFTAVMSILWIYSMQIVPGGVFHSMRILSPVIVLNSVCGSCLILSIANAYKRSHYIILSLMSFICMITFIQNIFVPYNPLNIKTFDGLLIAACIIPDPTNNEEEILDLVRDIPDNSAILSENALYHAILAINKDKNRGIRIVPVWSPEVKFLFDREISFGQCRQQLEKIGIRYVLIRRTDNLNMNYLWKFKFFRHYPSFSKALDNEKKLFLLTDGIPVSAGL